MRRWIRSSSEDSEGLAAFTDAWQPQRPSEVGEFLRTCPSLCDGSTVGPGQLWDYYCGWELCNQ